jgi:hypothetical protein
MLPPVPEVKAWFKEVSQAIISVYGLVTKGVAGTRANTFFSTIIPPPAMSNPAPSIKNRWVPFRRKSASATKAIATAIATTSHGLIGSAVGAGVAFELKVIVNASAKAPPTQVSVAHVRSGCKSCLV